MTTPSTASVQVIRSTSGTIGAAIAAVVALFLLGDAAVRGRWDVVLRFAPWLLLLVWAIYVALSASFIRVERDRFVVQNLLRRHVIPFSTVRDVKVRYQVLVELDDGRELSCWGAPAASKLTLARRNDVMHVPAIVRVRDRMREAFEGRDLRSQPPLESRDSWHLPLTIAGAALFACALSSTIL